jgi:drug/metabolite transporter (DMT)-like permease
VSDIPYLGEIAGLLTAVCWSGSSLVFSTATRRLGTVLVNISRLVLALVYLGVLIGLLGIPFSVTRSQIVYFGISGVIGLAFGDTFLFRAYGHIGPRLSMLVMSVAPAISAVCAWFILGEELSLPGIAGIIVTVAGVALVVYEPRPGDRFTGRDLAVGVFSAGIAAASQGVGLTFAKLAFLEGPVDGFVAATVRIAASLGVLLPVMLVFRRVPDPIRAFRNDLKGFWLTAVGSVLGPFIGITLSLIAVAHTKVGIAATLLATVPIIMLPMVYFFYRERVSMRSVVGACIAVAGVAVLFLH